MGSGFNCYSGPQICCRSRNKRGTDQEQEEPADHALGRSRGGFLTKIHLITDRNHNPLAVVLSLGAAHDSAYFEELIKKVSFRQAKGRPRNKPGEITADKGYDARKIRKELRRRGIRAMIPEKVLRPKTKRRKKGPHPRFDKKVYKERGKIEQAIGWLKEYRRLATRYDKTASNFMAIIQLAIMKFFLKKYSSDPAYYRIS